MKLIFKILDFDDFVWSDLGIFKIIACNIAYASHEKNFKR